MNRTLLFVLFLLSLGFVQIPSALSDEFFVASWNLENLFDTKDDPAVDGDEEYTPESAKHWTKERLDIKLKNEAHIISKMNDNKGPDVLGVCEVENRDVVAMLVEKLGSLHRKYEILHKDSPSERGIDCAIIYDSNVFTLASSDFHHVDAGNTRDIVEAHLKRNGNDLYVFMDHWPSRFHEDSYRDKAADVLRKRVDSLLSADPKTDIIMAGDFNDEPDNESIRDHLRAAKTADRLPEGALLDTTAPIKDAKKGTIVYKNEWELLDHIIISPGLLDPAGFQWKKGSTRRIDFNELIFHPRGKGEIPRPNQSYTRNDFHKTGYSDHLPVGCVLVQQPNGVARPESAKGVVAPSK
jgi:endonuclease/exonuclease/phosphatase family metal-dependent hydrolase